MLKNRVPAQRLQTPFVNQSVIIHGADYNPDQWLSMYPDILQDDAKLMQITGINATSVGIFSWTAIEPEEGRCTFDWLDKVMDQQHQIGNRVILATPSGAMPAWVAEKYPDARRVNQSDHRARYGGRHNHCWSSPSYHRLVKQINTQLANRYAKHPALAMWHISNELNGRCYCDLCRKSWNEWLEQRYGTLKQMNDAHWAYFWAHEATQWHHAEPVDEVMDGLALDWLRFNNQQLIDWYQFEADIVRKISPDIPITTNFMGTNYALNYQAISRVVDVVADDQYPGYDPDRPDFTKQAAFCAMKQDLYRCFKPDRTMMLMESCPGAVQWRTPQKAKRPGVHRLEMIQAIAHGADATCYFQFRSGRGSMEKLHGSVVEHCDTNLHTQTRRYRELRELSDTYNKITPILGTSVHAQIAILYDWESRWGQQLSRGAATPPPDWQANQRHYYDEIAAEHYQIFWQRSLSVDVISNDRDLSPYKLVVLPMHWMMTPDLSEKLRNYVANGGHIVATWDTAMADENNRMLLGGWPGEGLGELFGLWVEEVDRLGRGVPRAISGLPGTGGDVGSIIHLKGAKILATFSDDFYSGQPAVTRNAFGKGSACYVGTRLDDTARAAFYTSLLDQIACTPIFTTPLPEGVNAQLRGAGDDLFIFLLNFSRSQHRIALDQHLLTDLETDETHRNSITLAPLAAKVFKIKQK